MSLFQGDQNNGYTPTIEADGDSLTQGAGSNGLSYPTQLSKYYPDRLPVINNGIGGQVAEQIAARQGGLPVFLTIQGNALNGTTDVPVTSINIQLLSTAADQNTRVIYGVIAGVHCILTRTVVNNVETYTLKTFAAFNSTTIPAGSQFFPNAALNGKNHIQLIQVGRNNVGNVNYPLSGVPDIVDSMVNFLPRPRRVLVFGVLNALSENSTATGYLKDNYDSIVATNAILSSRYGDNFIPNTPPTDIECTAIGYTLTSQDRIDIANNTFPSGMRYDNVHKNQYGYAIDAYRAAQKINLFGW